MFWGQFDFGIISLVFPDTDECANHAHDCGKNAVCYNTYGSFTCSCIQGYKGNERQCDGTKMTLLSF